MPILKIYKSKEYSFYQPIDNKTYYEWIDWCIDNKIKIGHPSINEEGWDKMFYFEDYIKILKHFCPDGKYD